MVRKAPWTNLSMQKPQPLVPQEHSADYSSVQYSTEDAYNGGGCLQYKGNGLTQEGDKPLSFR